VAVAAVVVVEGVAAAVADPVAEVALGQAVVAHDLVEEAVPGLPSAVVAPGPPSVAVARGLPSAGAVLDLAAEYRPVAGRPRSARRVVTVLRNSQRTAPALQSVVADPTLATDRMLAAIDLTLAAGLRSCQVIGQTSAEAREEVVPAEIDLRPCLPLAPTSADAPV
jgi:hypothetical protein